MLFILIYSGKRAYENQGTLHILKQMQQKDETFPAE